MTASRRLIGQIFVDLGFITSAELDAALVVQREQGGRIGEILVAQGKLSRLDLASALSEHWDADTALVLGELGSALREGGQQPPCDDPLATVPDGYEEVVAELSAGLARAEDERTATLAALEARLALIEGMLGGLSARLEEASAANAVVEARVVDLTMARDADREADKEERERLEQKLDDLTRKRESDAETVKTVSATTASVASVAHRLKHDVTPLDSLRPHASDPHLQPFATAAAQAHVEPHPPLIVDGRAHERASGDGRRPGKRNKKKKSDKKHAG